MNKLHKPLTLMLIGIFLTIMTGYSKGADKIYEDVVINEVVNIYDGDTFTVNIYCWPNIIGKNISIRIYGIDTPEIRGTEGVVKKLALDAKKMTSYYLLSADVVELRSIRRGKYFRIIADVYIDGVSLGNILIKAGLAKAYHGGKRPAW